MTIQISLDSLEVLLEEHQLKDETQEQTIYRLLAELKNNRELLKMANDNPRLFIYQSALSRLNRKDLSNLVKDLAVYCRLTVFEHTEEEATDAIISIIEYLSNNWTKAQARELLFNLAIHCDMIPTYRKKSDNDVHDYLTYVFAKYVCGYVPKNNSLIDLEGFANAFVQNYEKIQYTDNNTKIGDLFQPKSESTAKKPEQ
jgi:hypothetical protein